jgi:hypothetical protein
MAFMGFFLILSLWYLRHGAQASLLQEEPCIQYLIFHIRHHNSDFVTPQWGYEGMKPEADRHPVVLDPWRGEGRPELGVTHVEVLVHGG